MRRVSPLTRFVLSAFGWIIALTVLWSQVSAWTSRPVAALAHLALEEGAPMWVRQVHVKPDSVELDSSVAIPIAQAGGRWAELTVEVNPSRYAYGLTIFLGLLLAARGEGRWWRAAVGYVMLLPFQAFSLVFALLMQLVLAAETNIRYLRISQWQMEAIVYAYQLGALVVPTLVPIVVWLWLDRAFVRDVLVRGWRESLRPAAQSPS